MSMTSRYLQLPEPVLAGVVSNPALAEELAFSAEPSPEYLDIDKSWHLIHFLLTGEGWGGDGFASVPILGGTELPDTDAGYGPFRYLSPQEVKATAKYLQGVSFESLWFRFVPEKAAAADIYPGEWDKGEVERAYIEHHYKALQQFFASASKARHGLLLGLS